MELTAPMLVSIVLLASLLCGTVMVVAGLVLRRRTVHARVHSDGQTLPKEDPLLSAEPPRGLIARIDRGFYRLIYETGLGLGADSALLLLVLTGVAIGGAVLIWLENVPAGLVTTGLAMFLPLLYFRRVRTKRLQQMYDQLPRMLHLLARSVRAGQSIDDAVRLAGRTGPDPLAAAFRRCARQLEMGLSMAAAMRAMVRHVPFLEIRMLAAAMSIQRRTGGNIALVLERLAAVVRDRQSYHRQFRAATAGGRFGVLLVMLCIPAYFTFMLVFQAEWMGVFFQQMLGIGIFTAACALLLTGLVWISFILRTDY